MNLHTGESLLSGTPEASWEERQRIGKKWLLQLAEDMCVFWSGMRGRPGKDISEWVDGLARSLEIDGYTFQGGRLRESDEGVIAVEAEVGVVRMLYQRLSLGRESLAFGDLSRAEEHYLAGRWDDAVSNTRQFLECVLEEVAIAATSLVGKPARERGTTAPREIRRVLRDCGLLEEREEKAMAEVYGLLSEVGSHPYEGKQEQARLLRVWGITFAEYALVRLEGMRTQLGQGK